jgi:uroporphyrinogen decarboxylase
MKTAMTSRQRILSTIAHQEPDRMPIDLGVHFSTGISAFAYYNLRKHLGLSTDQVEMIDCVQMLARVDEDILERFHVDTVLLNPPWPKPYRWQPREGYEFSVPDTFQPQRQANGAWKVELDGDKLLMPEGGFFFDGAWPDFYHMNEEDKLNLFARRAERLYKETDKFTMMMMGFSAFFGGLEFACDMLTDPDLCRETNQRILDRQIEKFDRMNKKFGKYVQAVEINSDLGTQQGLMCTPDSYVECCLPYLKKFCQHVHDTSDIKIFLHSCGSVYKAIPMLIEAGVDVLNPVQISAREMDPKVLKEQYGDKICFWGGGCETQTVLWRHTPEQIRAHVKELVSIFKPGGGFVFNQVHNIMGNVPPENIVAMLDAAYENSAY